MGQSDEMLREYCNGCGHQTNHVVLKVREQEGSEELASVGPVWWRTKWEMLECRGCEEVTLRRTFNFSENQEAEVTCFPPRVSRRLPPWHLKVPYKFYQLMQEIYTALHADSRRLAAMGARTLLDMLLSEKVGDVGGFKAKLNALESHGLVSARNRHSLEAALETGNAAAHRGHVPKIEDVNTAMDIIENLLEAVYVLEPNAARLMNSTPKRAPRTPIKKAPAP